MPALVLHALARQAESALKQHPTLEVDGNVRVGFLDRCLERHAVGYVTPDHQLGVAQRLRRAPRRVSLSSRSPYHGGMHYCVAPTNVGSQISADGQCPSRYCGVAVWSTTRTPSRAKVTFTTAGLAGMPRKVMVS